MDRRVDAPEPSWPGLLAVNYRAPGAVVCLLSAAVVHELTDELPVAVPRGAWRPKIEFPPVEVFSWARDTFDLGLESVAAAPGQPVPVYSPARTVVDLWRLRHR
jgi:hypothetical protein